MTADATIGSRLPPQLRLLLLAIFSDSLAVTIVFPILPFYVQFLLNLPVDEQYKIGFYTGLLGCSYTCGQVISAPIWGILCDRCGRRPTILVCLLGSSVFMGAFGLSKSFWMAFACRLSQGLFNGVGTVARTYIADITDETNETRSFALIGIVYGFGDIMGPSLGGLLSDPVHQYSSIFGAFHSWMQNLFLAYPYVAPCTICSLFGLCEFILILIALPESPKFASEEVTSGKNCFMVLRHQPLLRFVCVISVMFGAGIGAYDQLMPVWARAQLHVLPRDLGTIQALSGFVSIAASFVLITRLEAAVGIGNATCISLAIVTISYALPIVDIAMGWQSYSTISWAILSSSYFFKAVGIEACFTGVTILFTHSVPTELVGVAQGIGGSALNCGFTLGPLWGPSLFGLGSNMHGDMGGGIAFVLLVLVNIGTILLTRAFTSLRTKGTGCSILSEELLD